MSICSLISLIPHIGESSSTPQTILLQLCLFFIRRLVLRTARTRGNPQAFSLTLTSWVNNTSPSFAAWVQTRFHETRWLWCYEKLNTVIEKTHVSMKVQLFLLQHPQRHKQNPSSRIKWVRFEYDSWIQLNFWDWLDGQLNIDLLPKFVDL